METHQHEGEEREWIVDAAAAASTGKNQQNSGARVLQLLSDSKRKMKLKLMLIGRRVGGIKTTPPSDADGARVFLEQVSHVNDNDDEHHLHEDNTTITSIYTYKKHTQSVFTANNHTESVGADESIEKDVDQKYPWASTSKAFDAAQALPVVAAGSSSNSINNNNSSTSNEHSAVGAVREGQTTTTTFRSPGIWRKKQQPRTAPVASVTVVADDIEKDNVMLDSSSPHCSCPCGSTSNNSSNNTPPAATYSSIDNTDNKCTLYYQQLEHMTLMQYAQKKSDMADICKDLMQHQEKMTGLISQDIIHTRHSLIAEQELLARRQEQQAQHNVAFSRQQEEQTAKLDAILTAIMNQNNNHTTFRTTSNPMAKTTSNHHFHFDPPHHAAHADFREEEFNYLAALMKQQKRDILDWMEEAFATRLLAKEDIHNMKQQPVAQGEQNGGDSHDDDDDDMATLKAENALLKAKNKSLQETLVQLQWQQDTLLTENAALQQTYSKRDKETSQHAISKDKQESIASYEQGKNEMSAERYKEALAQTKTHAETLRGIKLLARNNNGNSNASSTVNRNRHHHQHAADDTITFTSTITSSSRSDDDTDQEHAHGHHERGLQQQPHKRQPRVMVIVGSRNKGHAHDLEEMF